MEAQWAFSSGGLCWEVLVDLPVQIPATFGSGAFRVFGAGSVSSVLQMDITDICFCALVSKGAEPVEL